MLFEYYSRIIKFTSKATEQGLASLIMSESNVLVSVEQVLKHFGIKPVDTSSLCNIHPQNGRLLLTMRNELMFGLVPKRKKNTHYGNT